MYKFYLKCKRLKSLARKVKERRFYKRLKRFIIISLKPLQPRGALYALIIVNNEEL